MSHDYDVIVLGGDSPGEHSLRGAREAAATAQVDPEEALARRDFMVSNYSDAGQERWLASKGIDLLRGSGRLVVLGGGPVGVELAQEVLRDTIQPFPTFSEIFVSAINARRAEMNAS